MGGEAAGLRQACAVAEREPCSFCCCVWSRPCAGEEAIVIPLPGCAGGTHGWVRRAGRLLCIGVPTVDHFCKRHHFIFICCREEFQLLISIFLRIFAVSFPISFLILNNLPTSDKQQTISGRARVNLVCGANDISTAAFTFPSDKKCICVFHHFCSSSCNIVFLEKTYVNFSTR